MNKDKVLRLLDEIRDDINAEKTSEKSSEDTFEVVLKDAFLSILSIKPISEHKVEKVLCMLYTNLHAARDNGSMELLCIHIVDAIDGLCKEISSPKLEKIRLRLLALIEKSGYAEIIVTNGALFGEEWSPSKYERKQVSSGSPQGTIIGVDRRGFLDKNGVCIQKAIVLVSR